MPQPRKMLLSNTSADLLTGEAKDFKKVSDYGFGRKQTLEDSKRHDFNRRPKFEYKQSVESLPTIFNKSINEFGMHLEN